MADAKPFEHIDRDDIAANTDVREAVGIFDTQAQLQEAIDELQLAGFDRFELGLVDTDAAPDAPAHHLADDPKTPRKTYVAPESMGDAQGGLIAGFAMIPAMGTAAAVAGTGAAVAVTAAATAATGGISALVGGAIAYMASRKRADTQTTQEDQGGHLLRVRVRTPEHEQKALDILRRHAAHHVHAHD